MLQGKDCIASEASFSIYICKICWKTWKVTQKITSKIKAAKHLTFYFYTFLSCMTENFFIKLEIP